MRETHIIPAQQLPPPLCVVGEDVTLFAGGDLTKPFEVHLQRGKQGGGPPPHRHPWDEAFFVLEGEVEIAVDGEPRVLPAGSYAHLPANTIHAYTNVSETAVLLAVVSDPRGGAFFEAVDRGVRSLPEDADKLVSIGLDHGVEFLLGEDAP